MHVFEEIDRQILHQSITFILILLLSISITQFRQYNTNPIFIQQVGACLGCGVVAVMHCRYCWVVGLAAESTTAPKLLNPDQFSRPAPFNFAMRATRPCLHRGLLKRKSACHTAFKLHRRAFNASANRRESLHPNSLSLGDIQIGPIWKTHQQILWAYVQIARRGNDEIKCLKRDSSLFGYVKVMIKVSCLKEGQSASWRWESDRLRYTKTISCSTGRYFSLNLDGVGAWLWEVGSSERLEMEAKRITTS